MVQERSQPYGRRRNMDVAAEMDAEGRPQAGFVSVGQGLRRHVQNGRPRYESEGQRREGERYPGFERQ